MINFMQNAKIKSLSMFDEIEDPFDIIPVSRPHSSKLPKLDTEVHYIAIITILYSMPGNISRGQFCSC